jgi:hypothetical protein
MITLDAASLLGTEAFSFTPLYSSNLDGFSMPLRADCIHKYLRARCNISYFSLLITDGWSHRCVAAYASDWTFIETALRPHKHIPGRNEMQVLSLDHSYVTLLSPWVFSFLSVVFQLASINILATITLVGFGHWVSCYQSVQSGQISASLRMRSFVLTIVQRLQSSKCFCLLEFLFEKFTKRNSHPKVVVIVQYVVPQAIQSWWMASIRGTSCILHLCVHIIMLALICFLHPKR